MGAPLGNDFWKSRISHGRKPIFDTPEEMQAEIDEYFQHTIETEEIPTMAGLALCLGMSSQTLRNYKEKDGFLATIKRARQLVEQCWEHALLRGGSGAIFWLKNNADYRDKKELEMSGALKTSSIDFSKLSIDTLREIKEAQVSDADDVET